MLVPLEQLKCHPVVEELLKQSKHGVGSASLSGKGHSGGWGGVQWVKCFLYKYEDPGHVTSTYKPSAGMQRQKILGVGVVNFWFSVMANLDFPLV